MRPPSATFRSIDLSDKTQDSVQFGGITLAQDFVAGHGGDAEGDLLLGIANLIGSNAADTLGGDAANNVVTGLGGNDTLNDAGGADTIFGGDGNDTLNGGEGVDRLEGGTGNDIYVIDSTSDVLVDTAGTDTVQSTVTYSLGSAFENLTLLGSAAINGTGNAAANVITGNSAANVLNGGTGADTLIGGGGNDTYVTDGGDTITEQSNGGTDTVQSSVAYTLGSNLENLTLTGTNAINGAGNTLDNVITGNSAVNVLNGGLGNDTLIGFAGNDQLIGGDGNDLLTGGADTDLLTGGAGADRFIFQIMNHIGNPAATRDIIYGLQGWGRGQDRPLLHRRQGPGLGQLVQLPGGSECGVYAGRAAPLVHPQRQHHCRGQYRRDKFAEFTLQLNGSKALVASDFIL